MYQPPRPPSFWHEFWLLTRLVYGILFWPVLALVAVLLAVVGVFVAFAIHWGFGLLALTAIALAVAAFARWESHRPPPPHA
ncbi:MAG: hypothetical protein Q8P22_01950 [Chloroflexota bacterium]|nr:hypothetical protein [Chloroflexota bacterium]